MVSCPRRRNAVIAVLLLPAKKKALAINFCRSDRASKHAEWEGKVCLACTKIKQNSRHFLYKNSVNHKLCSKIVNKTDK